MPTADRARERQRRGISRVSASLERIQISLNHCRLALPHKGFGGFISERRDLLSPIPAQGLQGTSGPWLDPANDLQEYPQATLVTQWSCWRACIGCLRLQPQRPRQRCRRHSEVPGYNQDVHPRTRPRAGFTKLRSLSLHRLGHERSLPLAASTSKRWTAWARRPSDYRTATTKSVPLPKCSLVLSSEMISDEPGRTISRMASSVSSG